MGDINWSDRRKESTCDQPKEEGQDPPRERSQESASSWQRNSLDIPASLLQTEYAFEDYPLLVRNYGQISERARSGPAVAREHDGTQRNESKGLPAENLAHSYSDIEFLRADSPETNNRVTHFHEMPYGPYGHLGSHHQSYNMFDDGHYVSSQFAALPDSHIFEQYYDFDRKLPSIVPESPDCPFPELKPPAVAALTPSKNPSMNSPRKNAKHFKGKQKTLPSKSAVAGERTNEHREPTKEECNEARHPRAEKALRSWYDRLNDLISYKAQYGHTNVPQKYAENRSLGIWVNKQRMERKASLEGKRNSMTEWKIRRLEQAGFVWGKPKGLLKWEETYQQLKEYKEIHGECNVPTKYEDNRALGRWVSTQRNMYKKYKAGKDVSLDDKEIERRIKMLEEMKLCWNMQPVLKK